MFPIEINGRYKTLVKVINRTVVLISISVSFFTLPTIWSVSIAIMIAAIGISVEKVVFVYGVVHINPMPQRLRDNQHVSIGYGYLDDEMKRPFTYLVFNTKIEAEESYDYFKAISMGSLIDDDNNLILSFVFEDEKRYTFYLYPAPHRVAAHSSKRNVEATLDKGEKVHLKVVSFIKFFPATFTGRGKLKDILMKFNEQVPIEFNTAYLKNGEIVTAKKRAIKKYHLRINDRSDLDVKSDVETRFGWYDPLQQRNKGISN